MRFTKSQSLATAVCIAIALQLFSVTANAVVVGTPSKLKRSEGRTSGSARAIAEAVVAPANGQTPPNPMEDEDAYAEYIADKIIAFCERIAKLPSQVNTELSPFFYLVKDKVKYEYFTCYIFESFCFPQGILPNQTGIKIHPTESRTHFSAKLNFELFFNHF